MVEGARLESVFTGDRNAGSNPALSASLHLGVIKIGALRQYDLAQAADAHRDLEARRTTGALVLGAISNTTDVP